MAKNKGFIANKIAAEKAAQLQKENEYYNAQQAPVTTQVENDDGTFTQVQTNTDAPLPTEPAVNTTTASYKEQAPENPVNKVAATDVAPKVEPNVAPDVEPADRDITGVVEEPTQEDVESVGLTPNATPEQKKKAAGNAMGLISTRDKDGVVKPVNKWDYADNIQKFGTIATIASFAVSAAAALAGVVLPPVNFSTFTGLDESYKEYQQLCKDYNDYVVRGRGKNKEEEIRAEQDEAIAEAAAKINNMQEKDLAKYSNDLAEHMQGVLTEGQLELIKANADVQRAMFKLMYVQDINRDPDAMQALLDRGFTMKDLQKYAQFIKSKEGQTWYENFLRGFNAAASGVGAVTSAVRGTGSNPPSDAGTKIMFKRMIGF